ncbi:hypothetical protein B0H13DRAFT_248036 [Mycena leptocephala]|nr:hypothetical protein B0H13DRAFT_248036 [Mycena leptocephala]
MGVAGAINGAPFPFRIGVASSTSRPLPTRRLTLPKERRIPRCATPAQTRKSDDEARNFNWAPPAAPAALRPIFPTSNACAGQCARYAFAPAASRSRSVYLPLRGAVHRGRGDQRCHVVSSATSPPSAVSPVVAGALATILQDDFYRLVHGLESCLADLRTSTKFSSAAASGLRQMHSFIKCDAMLLLHHCMGLTIHCPVPSSAAMPNPVMSHQGIAAHACRHRRSRYKSTYGVVSTFCDGLGLSSSASRDFGILPRSPCAS